MLQLDFAKDQTDAEKLLQLRELRSRNLYVIVRCGGYQIIHTGLLVDFNETGTILALSCLTEKFRNDYKGQNFTQHERKRNQWGNLIKPTDKFQYIPVALIHQVIDYNQKISQ